MHSKVNLIYGVFTLLLLQCHQRGKREFSWQSKGFNGAKSAGQEKFCVLLLVFLPFHTSSFISCELCLTPVRFVARPGTWYKQKYYHLIVTEVLLLKAI